MAHQSASPPVLIMELGAVSTFKTTMDEKMTSTQEMSSTMLNVPLALFSNMTVRMYFAERMLRKIRTTRTIRPQRNESIIGMLEIKSTHPHFKKKNFSLFSAR